MSYFFYHYYLIITSNIRSSLSILKMYISYVRKGEKEKKILIDRGEDTDRNKGREFEK